MLKSFQALPEATALQLLDIHDLSVDRLFIENVCKIQDRFKNKRNIHIQVEYGIIIKDRQILNIKAKSLFEIIIDEKHPLNLLIDYMQTHNLKSLNLNEMFGKSKNKRNPIQIASNINLKRESTTVINAAICENLSNELSVCNLLFSKLFIIIVV